MRNVTLGAVVIAALGAKTAQAAPPWCNVGGDIRVAAQTDVETSFNKSWQRALYAIVQNTCRPHPDSIKRAQEIEAARAQWSKQLGLSEADWADLADWATVSAGFAIDLSNVRLEPYDKRFAFSTLTPIDQFAGFVNGVPNSISDSDGDKLYLADALGPKLSETGRLGFVRWCVRENNPVTLAICGTEIGRLDRKKIVDEVRADNRSGREKMTVRAVLWQLDDEIASYKASVAKWKAKDPAYGRMFEIAEKTRKQWDTIWNDQKPLLDLVLAMDDARETRSKKALDGCEAKAWPAWRDAVAKIPASKFVGFPTDMAHSWFAAAADVVLATPEGYLVSVALASCLKDQTDKDALLNTLASVLESTPGLRGPHLASHWAIVSAGLELDEAGATIDYPRVRHDSRFDGVSQNGYYATVAKVGKPDAKGMVKISFSTKLAKQEQCLESRQAKQISRIRDDGSLEYNRDCLKWGTVAIDETPSDQLVNARYLGGLKPGMNAYIGGGSVMAVFPKGKKTPSAVAGAPVK